MRKVVVGMALALAFSVSACGQPPGPAAGSDTPSAVVASTPPQPVATATAVSSDDFGDVSTWVAAPGSFGPIGAAAPIEDLLARGYLVSKRVDHPCPSEQAFASPALDARGVSFGSLTGEDSRIHGIWASSAKVLTAKGIHTGSSATELAAAYGSALVDTPWVWGEGGADTRAKVLFDGTGGALVFLIGDDGSVGAVISAAGDRLDDIELRMGGGC